MISAHLITHQCVELDYCLEATIRSMMDLCDNIYINDGNSTDGTQDLLYSLQNEYGKDRVKIFIRNWQHNRQMWAAEKNFILDKIPMDAYILAIDADEVIHENEMYLIKKAVEKNIVSISFNVIHFYGRPTHYIEGPAWYKQHTRLWHKSTGIRLVHRDKGCADDVLWPDGFPAHLGRHQNCGANIYHYGNCRDPKALGRKAKKADDLYQYSNEYIGGLLAEPRSFTYAFDKVGAKLFKGQQPKYIKEWFDLHKDQETFYEADDNTTNKLWCFEE
jgi:hypothetical protein